jgi:hypothetical protein
MTEFREAAERFVSDFLDYIYKADIKDDYNKRTQTMERSPGVEALIKQAEAVFPARVKDGQKANAQLTDEQRETAMQATPNIVDTREMFSRRVQKNGGTQKLLRDLYEGRPGASDAVKEFFDAEDGKTKFSNE